jgi:hypothetical protein
MGEAEGGRVARDRARRGDASELLRPRESGCDALATEREELAIRLAGTFGLRGLEDGS